MLPVKAPRDPAPSRVKYRLERLWLRPTIRKFVKTGLPALFLAGLCLSVALDPVVQARSAALAGQARDMVKAHPGLMVQKVEIRDASDPVAASVAQVMQLDLPASSLDLDLAALQKRIVALDIVESASVRLETEGVLDVSVLERIPALVWRNADGLFLIDASGVRVDQLDHRRHRADLPLVAGEGADNRAREALDLLVAAKPLRHRTRALVRVGARRWDLVLDRGQRIRLPETDPIAALSRIIALDAAEDLLARDISVVDMRDGRRPTLRLTPPAWDRLQALRSGGKGKDA